MKNNEKKFKSHDNVKIKHINDQQSLKLCKIQILILR